MALISAANLVMHFGERLILDGVSFSLDAGEHVGLVGRNGCGKSTLMKLIAGLDNLKAESGQVQIVRGTSVGYLTQDPQLNQELTLREEAALAFAELQSLHLQLDQLTHEMAEATGEQLDRLLKKYEQVEHQVHAAGGYAVDHQIDATLHGLGLSGSVFNVKVKDLSGGQKGRLALAKLLLSQPDVLLLDEPTNHLDIAGRQWLENFLAGYRGAVMLVSHDRWLLDRVVHTIYEMEAARLYDYPGNYQKFRELRALRRLTQQRVYEKQQDKIKSEKAFIDRYRAGQRAKQAQGREKRLERFVDQKSIDRPIEQDEVNLQIAPPPRSGDMVLTADSISVAYDGKTLFHDLSMVLKRGDRIGIIGPNGAGKSTLVRCLIGAQQPDRGKVRLGSQLNIGHYRQTHEYLNLSLSVVEYLRPFVPSNTEQEARNLAGAFLFSGNEQDKTLGSLSGGERSRAVLAGLVSAGHNLLVLDEPTNHLDVQSAERLEQAMKQFAGGDESSRNPSGTLILVTHDRMLLDDIVNQLLILDGEGNAQHFLGNYSEYVQTQLRSEAVEHAAVQTAPVKPKHKAPPASGKPGVRQSDGASASASGGVSKLNQQALEQRIVTIEKKLSAIDEELGHPETYRDGARVRLLQSQRDELAGALAPLEAEWLRRAESA